MKKLILLAFACLTTGAPVMAASCCGGGSASGLILPKYGPAMVGATLSQETYQGYWDQSGVHHPDASGAKLFQTRLDLGAGYRIAPNWQASVSVPYVWNHNEYASRSYSTQGIGDMSANLWYENFDTITCITEYREPADLIPAMYFGVGLLLPTGISPFDDAKESFDITGRGFYRFDGSVKVEKSIAGWNAGWSSTFSRYLQRPVNREYSQWVEPYQKSLGDRQLHAMSFGYSWSLADSNSFTLTLSDSWLDEGAAKINHAAIPGSAIKKNSQSLGGAWATMDKDWIIKGSLSQASSGISFPKTSTFSLGVNYVFFE